MTEVELIMAASWKLVAIWGPIVVPTVIGVGICLLRKELESWRV